MDRRDGDHPLLRRPPEEVVRVLRAEGVDPDELQICTSSDFDPEGQPGKTWLVASRRRLVVASDGDRADGGGAAVVFSADLVRIEARPHNMLRVERHGREVGGIYAVRCMPVHHPEEFISLRRAGADSREAEVGMLRDLRQWPRETVRAVRASVTKRYMLQTIRRIESIDLSANHLNFEVETDLGPRRFTTRWHPENVQEYGARGRLVTDSDRNLYLIPDLEAMDERERRMLERFVYW